VQSVRGSGAQLPCRVQRVQIAIFTDGCLRVGVELVVLIDGFLRVGVVPRQALVGVPVVDDGLWKDSARQRVECQ
jgi:hypothetical protein